jgi:hypothetical protein
LSIFLEQAYGLKSLLLADLCRFTELIGFCQSL